MRRSSWGNAPCLQCITAVVACVRAASLISTSIGLHVVNCHKSHVITKRTQ